MHGYKFNFSENLVITNNLQNLGFKEWVFYSGMLFKSKPIWWEKGRKRKHLHEGLDIYFFRNENSEIRHIDSRFKIPVFYTGEVMRIIDDFLGETIFVRHGICKDKKRFYSIYGHTKAGVREGEILKDGGVLATIPDACDRKSPAPAHLHISIAWIPESLSKGLLTWETMNNSKLIDLIDPLQFFDNHTLLRRKFFL